MKSEIELSSSDKWYTVLAVTFSVIVVISNILSAKMVPLPFFNLIIPAGLITYPLTFLLSDLVTEIYGPKKSKLMVYTALGMCLLSFGIIEIALLLPTANTETEHAFKAILALSGLRIFSSLTAYIIAQIADIQLYSLIKKWTGPRHLWIRNNGSTCLSQLIDTVVVDILFLYWGLQMGMQEVIPIMVISYLYKAFFSFSSTPLLYLGVFILQKIKQKPLKVTPNGL